MIVRNFTLIGLVSLAVCFLTTLAPANNCVSYCKEVDCTVDQDQDCIAFSKTQGGPFYSTDGDPNEEEYDPYIDPADNLIFYSVSTTNCTAECTNTLQRRSVIVSTETCPAYDGESTTQIARRACHIPSS